MYEVKKITRADCEPFIIGIHYAKRWPSISYAFGLYSNDILVGVCTYGTPASATLRSGIAGAEMSAHVLELNRLCLKDNIKNEASILVSKSLKMLGDKIVVSFADLEQGHIGYVIRLATFYIAGFPQKELIGK